LLQLTPIPVAKGLKKYENGREKMINERTTIIESTADFKENLFTINMRMNARKI
jgi:hypothetical protein